MFRITLFAVIGCLVFFSAAHTGAAHAAVVEMRNGDRLSGQLVETDNAGIVLETSFGKARIPYTVIRDIYAHGEYMSQQSASDVEKAGRPLTASPADAGQRDSQAAEEQTASTTETASKQKKKKKQDDKITFLGGAFSGNVNFGASLQNGNSDKSSVNLDSTTKARWDDHRFLLGLEYNWAEDESEVTVDNRSLDLGYDYFYTDQWFVNMNAGLHQDDVEQLDLRSTVGVGIGHQAYESDDLNLKYILGPSYLRNDYENADTESSLAANWNFDYDQKFFDGYLKLFHKHKVFSPTDDWKAYLLETSTGARIPLLKGIVGTAQVDYDRDNDPAAGTNENDTLYSLKLGYEW
ncbi:MAG: DUF481 domain-containing protein [Alphaproteobacteria bacterium]|jgi:putative salt-induced outer membrane protein YdiY|nr:DUF481 domain-containing protein [Alphaproteobacteria bacterium]MDP7222429.1 DUF481 domain-containing protein [Alphaproteobacteria bacterium]